MAGLNLEQIEGVVDSLQSRHIALAPERCTRYRHRLSTCSRCLDACPVGAITCDGEPRVDWDRCLRCGACATACPTGALEARSPSNDEIWVQARRAAQERGWVGFACSHASLPGGLEQALIRTTCLARLDESLLLAGPACGAATVCLVAGDCHTCPMAPARALVDGVVRRANALLTVVGSPACIQVGSGLPPALAALPAPRANGTGVSRRGLFKTLARETALLGEAGVQARRAGVEPPRPVPVHAEGLPTALPEKRVMLVGALERLSAHNAPKGPGARPANTRFQAGEDGLWAGLKATADCTACQMCAFFCPTGALVKAEHDGRVAVVYQVSRCVNCLLCLDICYRQAVVALGEVDVEPIMAGGGELLCVRQSKAAPWQNATQERTAKAILDTLRS